MSGEAVLLPQMTFKRNVGGRNGRYIFGRDPHGFALEISGKSMEPVYRAGDYVIVSPSEQIRRGDRVALRTLSGEVMVKQLGHNTASRVELISLNPAFAKVSMLRSALSWIYRITWASQ